MLNSLLRLLKSGRLESIAVIALLLILSSCTPTPIQSKVSSDPVTDTNAPGGGSSYPNPTYPLAGTFLQEGAVRTTTNFSLPLNFSDSFMLRGDALSTYLRGIPNTTKFCLVGKFNYTTDPVSNLPLDKFLILAAKPKLFTDLAKKTTEYFLQVEPANDQSNKNDCLVYNLTNKLFSGANKPTASFTLNQLCSNCSNAATSTGLRLYFTNGQEVPGITTSSLLMTISGNTNGDTVNTCSSSTACVSSGFDCCLQGQCVKDGAQKPGVLNLPGFDSAKADVAQDPTRYSAYPQFYFVCESNTTGGSTGGGDPDIDPDYEAQVRIMEMGHLYECINKTDGEFSYCTVKIEGIKDQIPGVFPVTNTGDDVNFSVINSALGTGDRKNNIVRIRSGGQVLYQQGVTSLTAGTLSAANDKLSTFQTVSLVTPPPTNAQDDNLYITYKTDGTCQRMGANLAKCTKTYIQSSSDTSQTTYHDSSKVYLLPGYADASATASIIVKIGGMIVAEDPSTWSKSPGTFASNGDVITAPRITFNSSYPIFQNQSIEITYYVNSNVSALTELRFRAQSQVNTMCGCSSATGNCNLKPKQDNGALVDYECVSPTPASEAEAPANQTLLVSGKNVPHRYYDKFGVSYDSDYSSAPDQELEAFSYTGGAVTKPNNVSTYIGFNEIYGSFSKNSGSAARPAKMAKVKKDRTYDILVKSGSFSTCPTCGSDYYSSLQKIFPTNFAGQGGGYSPDLYESRREGASGSYRSDDLQYGRACFVPATMIPWTHTTAVDAKTQRQNRLTAQHFLFANGYNRDWFGFDYGSVIGSFDGVTWFSIGNQRRIKATTNKLYVAVNAYFGDLTLDNTFSVNITETSSSTTTSIPDHDSETDGAECQRAHFCSNDNDCIRTLGYDYSCQNVAGLTTSWPSFDTNAAELIGSTTKSLATLLGGTNGQAKRCVYRGKGAPCSTNLANLNATFNGSPLVGNSACSANNYCQPLASGSTNRFNTSIARSATTPSAQNAFCSSNQTDPACSSVTPSDITGLAARILGRPFDFYGKKTPQPGPTTSTLAANSVAAICIPGRALSGSMTTYDLQSRAPGSRVDSADKIIGAGITPSVSQTTGYYNACTATDNAGVLIQHYPLDIGQASINQVTINQNLSTNLLDLSPLVSQKIFSTTAGSQTTATGYQKNACLRAPGASCFSDLDCGPSAFAATKAKSADLSSLLVNAEEKFWEEEMVCGNPDFKNIAAGVLNPNYDIKKNFCCRESGNVLTTFTQMQDDLNSPLWCNRTSKTIMVAGVNQPINTKRRYSRVHTAYDKMTCDPASVTTSKTFALSVDAADSSERLSQILNQFKTLDTVNSRTCCTSHWVRSFHSENGGGHAFARTKMQTVDKTMFKHISWAPDNTTITADDEPFGCDPANSTNSSCEVKSLTSAEQTKYLTWAGSLELLGIPQVAVMANDQVKKLVDDDQLTAGLSLDEPLDNSIKDFRVVGEDFLESGTKHYYSAASYDKFEMGTLKKVFSENEFNCCIPAGKQVPDTTTASQCCTGFAATSGTKRCCLPDFTDVTVYLNRYVSSEGRGLPDSAYDPKTGYIKDPGQVQALVSSKNLCCSGKAMVGVAISQLPIPLKGNTFSLPATLTSTTKRFNYRTDDVDNNDETGSVGSFFDAGVRWNNHVYCVPADSN